MDRASTNSTLAGRRGRALAVAAGGFIAAAAIAFIVTGRAPAQDLEEKLDETQAELSQTRQREGVLTEEITEASTKIRDLESEVSDLREREKVVQAELDQVQAELDIEEQRLEELQARLARAVAVLEERLVEIYKSGEPDVITVILSSDGYDDLLERTEYLQRIQDQDSAIVGRVRTLRDETQATVDRITGARD
jgi:peptidoglycan hydrolase CwlO-like protein